MFPHLQATFGIAMRQSELMAEESERLSQRATSLARNLEELSAAEDLQLFTLQQQETRSPSMSSETDHITTRLSGLSVYEASAYDADDDESDVEKEEIQHFSGCSCRNCSTLVEMFNECLICRNPLQNRGVHDCSCCGKIWCTRCSIWLNRCGFCRQDLHNPLLPNRTLTNMVNSMLMPCANKSNGCTLLVASKQRKRHQRFCKFQVKPRVNSLIKRRLNALKNL